jgi:hypothetical protein
MEINFQKYFRATTSITATNPFFARFCLFLIDFPKLPDKQKVKFAQRKIILPKRRVNFTQHLNRQHKTLG